MNEQPNPEPTFQMTGSALEGVVGAAVRAALSAVQASTGNGGDGRRVLAEAVTALDDHGEERQEALVKILEHLESTTGNTESVVVDIADEITGRVAVPAVEAARIHAEQTLRQVLPDLDEATMRAALAGFAIPDEGTPADPPPEAAADAGGRDWGGVFPAERGA